MQLNNFLGAIYYKKKNVLQLVIKKLLDIDALIPTYSYNLGKPSRSCVSILTVYFVCEMCKHWCCGCKVFATNLISFHE